MKVIDVGRLPAIDRFFYWIRERHAIYERRQRGEPKPWTDDEVLQNYFFTNPYRENDKTTVWFRENVRERLRNDPAVLFATVAFRWFNYIPTGIELVRHDLLQHWKLATVKKRLRKLDRVFTGAFVITAGNSTKPKVDRVCDDYIQPVWEDRELLIKNFEECQTMQEAHRNLGGYRGFGGSGFMAYEIVCDIRHTYLLENATDTCSWSNPGPGAKRGLNRLLGRAIKQPIRDWGEKSAELLARVDANLKGLPRFEMREIEHSLCEFDKYERALFKDGRTKRKYDGN